MPVKYRVPYELSIIALDNTSNQAVNNVMHYRGGIDATPPAYGSDIAASDIATVLSGFRGEWRARILPHLSLHYVISEYRIKEVTGWSVQSTPRLVGNASFSTPITITTVGNHNVETGDTVTITGVTGNTAANGVWVITVTGDDTFTLAGSVGNALFAGGGEWTVQQTTAHLTYGEQAVLPGSPTLDVGAVIGQSLPVFTTWSVFKKTNQSGRNFRGGMRLSPIAETSVNNGRAEAAIQALRQTAVDELLAATLASGGAAGDGGVMQMVVFSRSRAFTQPGTFTQSETIAANVQALVSQPNSGSMTRRKPKLTDVITLT